MEALRRRIWEAPAPVRNPQSLRVRGGPYMVHYFVFDKRKQSRANEREEAAGLRYGKRVQAVFYRTEAGGEPVREWLKSLPSREDRKRIGEDIKTVDFWLARGDAGMPLRGRRYL